MRSGSLPRVLISVLNWNASDLTIKCLESMASMTYPIFEIVVVDNASVKDDVERMRELFPNLEIISNARNLGFAGGHNQVIRMAIARGFDYIWLVNNDCITQPTDLEKLVACAESNHKIGIVSPVIVVPSDEDSGREEHIQFAGSWFDWEKQECVRPKDPVVVAQRECDFPLDMWVTGTAMLIRCAMLDKIGGLDERYFAYYEDNELGARASRQGYLSQMAFDVTIRHHSFTTTHDRPPHYFYLCSRNSYLFWTENIPRNHRRTIRRCLWASTLLEAKSLQYSGHPELARACMAGLFDAVLGNYGSMPSRFQRSGIIEFILRFFPYRLALWLKLGR